MRPAAPDPFAPRAGDTDIAQSHEEAARTYCQRLCERYMPLEVSLRAALAHHMRRRSHFADASLWAASTRTALDKIIGQVPAHYFPSWPRVIPSPEEAVAPTRAAPKAQLDGHRLDSGGSSDMEKAARAYVRGLIARFPRLEEPLQSSLRYQLGLYESRHDKLMWARMAKGAFDAKVSRAFPDLPLEELPDWPDTASDLPEDDAPEEEQSKPEEAKPDMEMDDEATEEAEAEEAEEAEAEEAEAEEAEAEEAEAEEAEAEEAQVLRALAPRVLAEVLEVRIGDTSAAAVARSSPALSPDTRLCDLDGALCARLSRHERKALEDAVCGAAAGAFSLSSPVRAAKLPALPRRLKLAQLALRVRPHNCLRQAGLAQDLSPLSKWTIGALFSLPNLGVRSLIEILCALEAFALPAPVQVLGEDEQEEGEPEDDLLSHTHNARLGELLASIDDHTHALGEQAHALAHALHTGASREQSNAALQAMSKCLQGVAQAVIGLQVLAEGLEDGQALERALDLALAEEVEKWAALLFDVPSARAINAGTFDIGPLVVDILVVGESLEEKIKALATRLGDPAEPDPVRHALATLREQVEARAAATLEDELDAIIASYLRTLPARAHHELDVMASPEDKALALRRRLGWDGNEGGTLEEVAGERKVSRERVRQVEGHFKRWFAAHRFFSPALERVLSQIHDALPGEAGDIEAGLQSSGALRGGFLLEAVAEVVGFFGVDAGFQVQPLSSQQDVLRLAWAVREGSGSPHAGDGQKVWKILRDHVWERGIGHAASLAEEIQAQIGGERGEAASALGDVLLETLPQVRWLDRDGGWFWMEAEASAGERQPNRLLALVERTLSVARRLEVARLHAALERHHGRVQNKVSARPSRLEWEMPPLDVFEEWCHQSPVLRVHEGQAEMQNTPPLEQALSGVELGMVQVLRDAGGSPSQPSPHLLSRLAFQQACAERGIARPTFYVYVDGLATIEPFADGVFGLSGANPLDEELARATAENERVNPRVTVGCGRLADGRAWIRYRASEVMCQSGNCPCPATLKDDLQGRFELRDVAGSRAGTLVFNGAVGWGLGPILRRRGQTGDDVLLLIDTGHAEAIVALNNAELDEATIQATTPTGTP